MLPIKLLDYKNDELAHYMEHRQVIAEKIIKALTWLAERSAAQGYTNLKSPSELVDYVLDNFYLLTVDATLVAFSVAEPWFMSGQVICEEFIAPLTDEPAPLEDIVRALEAAGRSCGATILTVGTRANPHHKGLAHVYEKLGARISAIELIKEIPKWEAKVSRK